MAALTLQGHTVGGGLIYARPHFIGMHALQVLPLFAIALGWLGRRWRVVADDRVRARLVLAATVVYAAVLALVTFQAVAGQSIVHPRGVFLVGGWVVAVGGLLAVAVVLALGIRSGARADRARPTGAERAPSERVAR